MTSLNGVKVSHLRDKEERNEPKTPTPKQIECKRNKLLNVKKNFEVGNNELLIRF